MKEREGETVFREAVHLVFDPPGTAVQNADVSHVTLCGDGDRDGDGNGNGDDDGDESDSRQPTGLKLPVLCLLIGKKPVIENGNEILVLNSLNRTIELCHSRATVVLQYCYGIVTVLLQS
jgi:hypothetical protein